MTPQANQLPAVCVLHHEAYFSSLKAIPLNTSLIPFSKVLLTAIPALVLNCVP